VILRTPGRRSGRLLRGGAIPAASTEKPTDDGGRLSREVGRGGITTDGCSIEKLRGPPLILSSEPESRPLHGPRDLSDIERAVSWNTRAIPVLRSFQA